MRPPNHGPLAGPLASARQAREPGRAAGSGAASDATHPPHGDVLLSGRTVTRRVSQHRLDQLAEHLPARERELLEAVGRLRLLRADQIRRLFFREIATEAGRARLCRRSLQRLDEAGLVQRLERRIGGASAGSGGHIYALTAAGRRLVAYWSGSGAVSDRGVYEPGAPFVAHTLAIAAVYAALVEADREGALELLGFDTEPACWRTFTTQLARSVTLKPDALVRVAAGEYEYVTFVEVDLGSEGRGALLRKCGAYLDYYRSGREQTEQGLFPRVLWITTTTARARYLDGLLAGQPADARRLFATATMAMAVAALAGANGGATAEEEVR